MAKATSDQKLTLTEFLNICTQDVNYETDNILIIDDLLPGLKLTVNQLFTEAELI